MRVLLLGLFVWLGGIVPATAGLLTYKMIFYLDNGAQIGHGSFAYNPKDKIDLYVETDDVGLPSDQICYTPEPGYCEYFNTWTMITDLTIEVFGEYFYSEFSLWVEGTYASYHGYGGFQEGWRIWNYSDNYVLELAAPVYFNTPSLQPTFLYLPTHDFADTIYVAWFQTPLPAAFFPFLFGMGLLASLRVLGNRNEAFFKKGLAD